MTDLLLERVLNQPAFTWGGQDLSKSGAGRRAYITALHSADENNYWPLLNFARTSLIGSHGS
jgi:hypothetical protein